MKKYKNLEKVSTKKIYYPSTLFKILTLLFWLNMTNWLYMTNLFTHKFLHLLTVL